MPRDRVREPVVPVDAIPFIEEGWRKWNAASPTERAAAVAEVAELAAQLATLR